MGKTSAYIVRMADGSLATFFLLLLILLFLPIRLVDASSPDELISRSLTVTSSANGLITSDIAGNPAAAGSGGNGAETGETFSFILPQTGNVGSIDFLYCTTPLPGTSCTAPTGLSTSNVHAVQAQTNWAGGTSFSVSSVTSNEIKISQASPVNQTNTSTPVILTFGGLSNDYITNPTTSNTTFFVRISLYSDNAFTNEVDQGTVASSTATQINLTAKVQEELAFSVGTTYVSPNSPTCTPFNDAGALQLGDSNGVLSASQAYFANSYFRVSTNATHGLVIEYSGNTLTSGSNNITAIGTTEATSTPGSPQFGLGMDLTDPDNSFTYLTPTANYGLGGAGTPEFAFSAASTTSPVPLATSNGIIVCDTGSVRYIGNIAYSTPAGIYNTTITYIAIPTY